jgi:hypothetical protein
MTFNYENIPKEIKKYKRFVLFNRNKAPKTIYNNGAKANDPNTWNSFDECYKAWVSNPDKFMGIGIELGELEEGKVLAGIDLDHIIDDDGNIIDPSFEILIEKIGSYTEISPSGKGIHILFFLNEIMDSVKSNIEHFEFYSQGRYFTMTGNIYKEHKELKQLTTEQLDFILEKTIFMPDLKEGIEESENLNQTLIEKGITIEKVVNYYSEKYPEFKNLRKKGTNKYWTKSPFHSSNTGHNFELNYDKNVWYCWRHNLGGSVFELIAFCEGILSCKDYNLDPEIVRPRTSRDDKVKIWENKKEQFKKTLEVLKEKFNIDLMTKYKERENTESKNDEEEKYEISYYSKFSYQGKFYNEVKTSKGYKFIIFDRDGNIEGTTEEVIIEDIEKPLKILPAPQITERRTDILLQEFGEADLIKFPGYPVDFGMPIDLFNEIRNFIHKYVEVKNLDEILLTIYVMQSAVFDLENKFTFPLVHVIGPYGRGKTRILTILNYLIPYSLYTDDIKAPAIKRVSQLYNPVLLVDEKGQMDSDLRAILNARYNKNATILNANKEIQKGYAGIIAYRIPGPMVMAGREVFNDPAIESKSFQINMNFELTREDIPRNLKGEIFTNFIREAEIIRSKLMMFRIKYFKKINELINIEPSWLKEYERIAEPRLYELMSSLTDILNVIPELEPEIREIIEDQIKENVLVAQETPEGIIAKIIIDIIKDWINGKEKEDSDQEIENIKEYEFNGKKYKGIYLKVVQNELGENYKQRAGMILSQLGFIKDRARIKISYTDRDNNQKEKIKRISFIRIPDFKNLLSLFKRYDIEYINMMIKLSKIGITENLQSINLNEVEKSLAQLDQLAQLKIYIYDVNSFVNFYKGLLDIYENEGYNFLLGQLVQLVQAIAKDKKINLENTEPVSKNQYKYFRSEVFYSKEFFADLGIIQVDSFDSGNEHYYQLEIPNDLIGENAYKFSSFFSMKAIPVSEEEFKQKSKEALKNDP